MADPVWPETPLWRTSWDNRMHGFPELGDPISTALCGHKAWNSSLTAPVDSTEDCPKCLRKHVRSLADGTAGEGQ